MDRRIPPVLSYARREPQDRLPVVAAAALGMGTGAIICILIKGATLLSARSDVLTDAIGGLGLIMSIVGLICAVHGADLDSPRFPIALAAFLINLVAVFGCVVIML